MLACDKTITLIKCDGETYTGTVIQGVSWFDQASVKVEGTGMVFANATKVRIPAYVVPQILPQVGDQLILGTLPLGFVVKKPADLAPFQPRKVMAVGDNRRGRLSHVLVICQ